MTANDSIEGALADPAGRYGTPRDVLEDAALTPAERRQVLERWLVDARATAVAVEEGMPGESSPLIGELTAALAELDPDPNTRSVDHKL
jgi:hypothetical protein